MTKLIAIYRQPEDKQAFDEHYFQVHAPLAEKMPGLKKLEVTRFVGTPTGGESPYYLMAEMVFEDRKALDEAMASAEGRAAAKDLMGFAGKLVTMMIGETASGDKK